jgi:ubiquinone/menaquinone biosynthesis C-methylase UbiE
LQAKFKNEAEFAQWNEEMALKYDPEAYHLRSNFLIRWIERRRVKTIIRMLDVTTDDDVLEVGCGAGNVLEKIPNGNKHGIDLSSSLLQKSQQRLADQGGVLALANAENLPFSENTFSRVVCTEVLEHVIDPRNVLREMARVARQDAVLVISIPNERLIERVKGIIRMTGMKRWLLKGKKEGAYQSPDQMTDEWHLHCFDIGLLSELLENILVINKIQAIPFLFVPFRYAIKCSQTELGNDK